MENENQGTPSVEEQVNTVLQQMSAEDFDASKVDPVIMFAATAEKRRRDTQSEFTKVSQKAKKLEATNAQLSQVFEQELVQQMSPREAAELEELKFSDPDAWRNKLVTLEEANKGKIKEKLQQIEQEAVGKTEIELRVEQLQAFNEAHPGFELNDEIVQNDIPPRITRKLEKGEISFAEFLQQSYDYLNKGKVIGAGEAPPDIPNLGKAPGGSTPAQSKNNPSSGYNDEVY